MPDKKTMMIRFLGGARRRAEVERTSVHTPGTPDLEKRALHDFTSAMEEVRRKLCHYLGIDSDVPWERLTLAVEKAVIDRDNAKAGSANVFLAVNVVREQLWKIRDLAAKALGEEPPDTHGNEHLAVTYVERLIERLEQEQTSHRQDNEMCEEDRTDYINRIEGLREDLKVFQEGDETLAGSWKAHFLDLAMTVGVPRVVCGSSQNPQVDDVMTYVGQVMPTYKLLQKVDGLEKRFDAIASPSGCSCGVRHPPGVAFCPRCGKDYTEPAQETQVPKPIFEGSQFKFKIEDTVFLTSSEAQGETGVVTDVGFQPSTGAQGDEYVNVRLDKDGSETGPMPVTCVCHLRKEDA